MSSGTGAIERRLTEVSSELRSLREELRVTDAELQHFAQEADDGRVRALVSDEGMAQRDARDANRHAEAVERQRRHLVAEIERLERTQDDLLDELQAAKSGRRP
jgi:chromosome segregation ATPase